MSMLKDKMQIDNRTTPKVIRSGTPSIYEKDGQWFRIGHENVLKVTTMTMKEWKDKNDLRKENA